jgi:hypothetical protein
MILGLPEVVLLLLLMPVVGIVPAIGTGGWFSLVAIAGRSGFSLWCGLSGWRQGNG